MQRLFGENSKLPNPKKFWHLLKNALAKLKTKKIYLTT